MTAQIDDIFELDGVFYALAGISEGELFDPAVLGLEAGGFCTGCYRGYQAEFSLEENQLVVKTLHINLFNDPQLNADYLGPKINGVWPTWQDGPSDWFNNHYTGLNYHLEYTGGLLIARDFIHELYVHMGFHPAWKYKTVRELIFDKGLLTSDFDRSQAITDLRQSILTARENGDSTRFPSPEESRRFVEEAFDRKYEL